MSELSPETWNELAAGYLAERLSDEQVETLLTVCRSDATRRAEIAALVRTDRLMQAHYSPVTESDRTLEIMARIQDAGPDISGAVIHELTSNSRQRWYLTLAAVIAIAVISAAVWLQPARVVEVVHSDVPSLKTGAWLRAGEHLVAEKGELILRYLDGTLVTIEGPADYLLHTSDRGELRVGQATVTVGAKPPVIHTASLKIENPTDAYGLRITAAGETEVHVFSGELMVTSASGNSEQYESRPMSMTQAATFGNNGLLRRWSEADYAGFSRSPDAPAGIRGTTRNIRILAQQPASVEQGALQSNQSVQLIPERTNFTLPHDVTVTMAKAFLDETTSSQETPLGHQAEILSAGTRVDSFLLHFDPAETPQILDGEIVFNRRILAVIAYSDQLSASDALFALKAQTDEDRDKDRDRDRDRDRNRDRERANGITNTRYPEDSNLTRGLDPDRDGVPADVLIRKASANTLGIRFEIGHPGVDQLRILIEAEPESEQPAESAPSSTTNP